MKTRKFYTAFLYPKNEGLHCTHKYLGVLTPSKFFKVADVIDDWFKKNPTDDAGFEHRPRLLFALPKMFGDRRVLLPVDGGAVDLLPQLRKILDPFREDDFKPYRPHITTDERLIDEKFEWYALMSGNNVWRKWPLFYTGKEY